MCSWHKLHIQKDHFSLCVLQGYCYTLDLLEKGISTKKGFRWHFSPLQALIDYTHSRARTHTTHFRIAPILLIGTDRTRKTQIPKVYPFITAAGIPHIPNNSPQSKSIRRNPQRPWRQQQRVSKKAFSGGPARS